MNKKNRTCLMCGKSTFGKYCKECYSKSKGSSPSKRRHVTKHRKKYM